MQLSDLRTELLARGSDYLDSSGTTRQDLFINAGYRRINESGDNWPWLFADASGTAPLTISDLQVVRSVVDASNTHSLDRIDRRYVVESLDPTLVQTGTPTHWYRDSDTTIKIWPANTAVTVNVRYLKVPPTLSGPTDTPVIPTRYHPIIIDAAFVEVLKDSEDYSEMGGAEQVLQQRLAEMRKAYIDESGPDFIDPTRSGWIRTY